MYVRAKKYLLHLWSLISWQMCLALLCLRTASLLICFLSSFTACWSLGFAIKWWFKKKKKYQYVHLDDHIGVCCQQIVEISKSTFQIGSWKEQSSSPCSTAVAKMMITKPCGFLNFLKNESCSVQWGCSIGGLCNLCKVNTKIFQIWSCYLS